MKLQIEINMDNDAFVNNEASELTRMLSNIPTKLTYCFDKDKISEEILLMDINGNRVGYAKLQKSY